MAKQIDIGKLDATFIANLATKLRPIMEKRKKDSLFLKEIERRENGIRKLKERIDEQHQLFKNATDKCSELFTAINNPSTTLREKGILMYQSSNWCNTSASALRKINKLLSDVQKYSDELNTFRASHVGEMC